MRDGRAGTTIAAASAARPAPLQEVSPRRAGRRASLAGDLLHRPAVELASAEPLLARRRGLEAHPDPEQPPPELGPALEVDDLECAPPLEDGAAGLPERAEALAAPEALGWPVEPAELGCGSRPIPSHGRQVSRRPPSGASGRLRRSPAAFPHLSGRMEDISAPRR